MALHEAGKYYWITCDGYDADSFDWQNPSQCPEKLGPIELKGNDDERIDQKVELMSSGQPDGWTFLGPLTEPTKALCGACSQP